MADIKSGTIVFATSDCKDGIADARAWLKDKAMTPADVRLFVHGGQVLVQTLRHVALAYRIEKKD